MQVRSLAVRVKFLDKFLIAVSLSVNVGNIVFRTTTGVCVCVCVCVCARARVRLCVCVCARACVCV
jgi:hypothetical protein